jgi:hypothetical protein
VCARAKKCFPELQLSKMRLKLCLFLAGSLSGRYRNLFENLIGKSRDLRGAMRKDFQGISVTIHNKFGVFGIDTSDSEG